MDKLMKQFVAMCLLALMCSCTSKSDNEAVDPPYIEETEMNPADSESPKQTKEHNHEAIEMFLTKFYSEYIFLVATSVDGTAIRKLRESVCTPELITRINAPTIDYDPLIDAQDAHESSVESLKVKQCGTDNDNYCVSYRSEYDGSITEIQLRVEEVKGQLKITDIVGL